MFKIYTIGFAGKKQDEFLEILTANGVRMLTARQPEKLFSPESLDGVCFLCTEKSPAQCHRRLVAEYLAAQFPNTEIVHL